MLQVLWPTVKCMLHPLVAERAWSAPPTRGQPGGARVQARLEKVEPGDIFMVATNNSVPTEPLSEPDCKGLADVLASVGDKWTIMVVGSLSRGPVRYNEIQ